MSRLPASAATAKVRIQENVVPGRAATHTSPSTGTQYVGDRKVAASDARFDAAEDHQTATRRTSPGFVSWSDSEILSIGERPRNALLRRSIGSKRPLFSIRRQLRHGGGTESGFLFGLLNNDCWVRQANGRDELQTPQDLGPVPLSPPVVAVDQDEVTTDVQYSALVDPALEGLHESGMAGLR